MNSAENATAIAIAIPARKVAVVLADLTAESSLPDAARRSPWSCLLCTSRHASLITQYKSRLIRNYAMRHGAQWIRLARTTELGCEEEVVDES